MRSRLERLLAIEQEIRRGRYPNVERLCTLFEVQPRTIFADIRELKKKVGLRIRFDRNRNGYYNADPTRQLPSFDLTGEELFGLALGAHLLGRIGGTSFEAPLTLAMDKICSRTASAQATLPESIARFVLIHQGPVTNAGLGMVVAFFWSCMRSLSLEIATAPGNGDGPMIFLVDPYRLVCRAGSWDLAAYCHDRDSLRLFPVSEIHSYRVLKESFEPLADPEVDEWLASRLPADRPG